MLAVFHGWRRKMGCAMLLLACLFMVGWIRSISEGEVILVSNRILFTSDRGWFAVSQEVSIFSVHQHGHRTGRRFGVGITNDEQLIHRWAIPRDSEMSFQLGGCPQIPYWSIILPLILVSTYLLFSKPRASKRSAI